MRLLGRTPVVGKISNGGPYMFIGLHEMEYVSAQFVHNPLDANSSISPELVSDAMAVATVAPPPVGAQYGSALVPGTEERARLDAVAEQLGINQFAWAKPGEAYLIQSIAAQGGQGADHSLNYARTTTGQQLDRGLGFHLSSPVVNSTADDAQIVIENSRRSDYREALDQAIEQNLHKQGHNLSAIKRWLESQPGGVEAEPLLVDALAAIQENRKRLADPSVAGGDRQRAEVALQRAELDGRIAIVKIAGPQLPKPGQMWELEAYSRTKGFTCFDDVGRVDNLNMEMGLTNPLAVVTSANQSAVSYRILMQDAKNLDPVRVASGEQSLPGIANSMLTGLAETAVRAALWRHDNAMPLPELKLHGYGNSRLHGFRTGQTRANAAAAWGEGRGRSVVARAPAARVTRFAADRGQDPDPADLARPGGSAGIAGPRGGPPLCLRGEDGVDAFGV